MKNIFIISTLLYSTVSFSQNTFPSAQGAPIIRLQHSADGVSAYGYLEFNDVNSRMGWVGFGSSANNTLYFNNETGGDVSIPSGNVGVGLTSPQDLLHIADGSIRIGTDAGDYGQFYYSGGGMAIYNKWVSSSAYIRLGAGNVLNNLNIMGDGKIGIGTSNPSNTVQIGPNLNNYNGYDFVVSSNLGNIGIHNAGGQSVILTSHPIQLKPGGSLALHADPSGNVAIGTDQPDAKLTVKGDIHTQEVTVDLQGAVAPDFVFEEDYDLKSLEETEEYIQVNKHLPEIPSAPEMEENGFKLKEMNLKLLQKVEELTLHLIEQNKELKNQKDRIAELERKLEGQK